jgi:hypothetical protein
MSIDPSCRYAMLVCYLPPLPAAPFAIRQAPLSRLQLDRRLALLSSEDAEDLATIESLAHWDRIPLATGEQRFLVQAQHALDQFSRPSLREMLRWRLEMRTLVGALRRRHRGLPSPSPGEAFGFGQCVDAIRRHWEESDFRLGHLQPWVSMANEHIRAGNHVGLEHLLFSMVWNHYTRLAWDHHFDFEAVVLYVLRWNLIDRLARHDAKAARQRFEALLAQGLEGHDGMSKPEPLPATTHGAEHG